LASSIKNKAFMVPFSADPRAWSPGPLGPNHGFALALLDGVPEVLIDDTKVRNVLLDRRLGLSSPGRVDQQYHPGSVPVRPVLDPNADKDNLWMWINRAEI
jgi:hypothetical protein